MRRGLKSCYFVAVSLSSLGVAIAQDTSDEGDTIVVRGIKKSLEEASDIKRESDAVVDAISSTDLGRFPDENVADSLQRITGVQINRFRGEGSTVTIRGLRPDFTSTQLNGRTLPSGNSDIAAFNASISRNFNFQLLPSEFVSRLEVYKSPTASLQEGGLGGTVIVRTVRPLDLGRRQVAASLQGAWDNHSDALTPRASAVYSDVFMDGKLGFAGGFAYTKRNSETHELEVQQPFVRRSEDGLFDFDGDGVAEPDQAVRTPFLPRQDFNFDERERISGTAVIEFEPTENINLYVDAFYTTLDILSPEASYNAFTSNTALPFTPSIDSANTSSSLVGGIATPTTLAINGVDFRGNNRIDDREQETLSVALGGSWESGPWRIEAEGSVSSSEQVGDDLILATRYQPDAIFAFEPGQEALQVFFDEASEAGRLNPENYGILSINGLFGQLLKDDVNEASFDVDYEINGSLLTSVEFGIRATWRDLFSDDRRLTVTGPQIAGIPGLENLGTAPNGTPSAAPYMELYESGSGDFIHSLGRNGVPNQVLSSNWFLLRDQVGLDALVAAGSVSNNAANIIDVEEDIIAGYIQGNYELMDGRLSGNAGVRVVTTDQTSFGVEPDLQGITQLQGTGVRTEVPPGMPVTAEKTYTNVLPSFNAKYEMMPDNLLRFAVSRTMTRARLNEITPVTTADANSQTINQSNPDLDPFLATNVDFGYERYFGAAGAFTILGFYKQLENVVTVETSEEELPLRIQFADGRPDEFDTINFTINELINSDEKIDVYGFEVGYTQIYDFLPAPFDGLGFQGNYTYVKNSNEDILTDVSAHNFNLGGLYEKGPIGARLSYTWRADFLATPPQLADDGMTVIALGTRRDARGVLDANLTFDINDNLSLVLEGINLTDSEVRATSEVGDLPVLYQSFGRRVLFGARARF